MRHAGAAGARLATFVARTPFGPDRLRELLERSSRPAGSLAVDRDWFMHPDASDRLRARRWVSSRPSTPRTPCGPGMSREELRSRAGSAEERVFAQLLTALEAEGVVKSERDKVRLASHEVRLTPDQQRVVERLEADFRAAGAAPAEPRGGAGPAGRQGHEEHELFQVLVADRKLVRVKESLFFHAEALRTVQAKLVALPARAQGDRAGRHQGPVRDQSRKYAIPLLEFFDAQRVTARVGERRVLERAMARCDPGSGA